MVQSWERESETSVGGAGDGLGGVGSNAREFADETCESPFVITAPYPSDRRFVDAVERDGLAMEFHSMHRPLDAYTGALHQAGFLIEALHESVPDEDYVREHPRLQRQ